MRRLTRNAFLVVGGVALLAPLVAAPPALAAGPRVTTLAGAYRSPLQFAVRGNRVLLFTLLFPNN